MILALGTVLITLPASPAIPNKSVVEVGQQTLTVSDLQRRWQELPLFQRMALGKTDPERTKAFVEQWVVPDMLWQMAAADRHSLPNERSLALEKSVMQQVLAERVRTESEYANPVTDADIKAYFESHRQDFDRPERLRLFRIVVASEVDALAIIKKIAGAPDLEVWRNLAREKSLDRATFMRGGELGFVAADGKSDLPELQIDPVLYAAAARLKDGEISKTPVREGQQFAVIWRRGHVPAVHTSLASVADTVKVHLRESRAATALADLVAKLRASYVKDLKPQLLDGVPESLGEKRVP
jgi:peptidyl-prolyl cis-trans isomerase C